MSYAGARSSPKLVRPAKHGRAQPVATMVWARFNGTRSGKRYHGTLVTPTGGYGSACQFTFLNDTGVETLLYEGDYVFLVECPSWLLSNPLWSIGGGTKYVGLLSPYAAWR